MPEETRNNPVSLGCGTLILIALIVLIFGGGPSSETQKEVQKLRLEVQQLKQGINQLEKEIRGLKRSIERQAE